MLVRWTSDAAADLEYIVDHIQEDSPGSARKVVQTIIRGIKLLDSFLQRGRPGTLEGTRELVFAPLPYLAVYRIHEETVEILHIYHGAQDWM